MVILRLILFFLIPLPVSQATSQEWQPSLHSLLSHEPTEVEIDDSDGAFLRSESSREAPLIHPLPVPFILKEGSSVEIGTERFYLTADARGLMFDDKPTCWVSFPATTRAEFIAGTTLANLVKRGTRDFFRTDPETAEVHKETVNPAQGTDRGPADRRAEIDFHLPPGVVSPEEREGDVWDLTMTVYPALESNVDRIPAACRNRSGAPNPNTDFSS